MSEVYQNIKKYRLEAGMTLLEVANKLGVKEATVQRYESGIIKNLKYDTIVALSEIFGCSPVELMGWEDNFSIDNSKSLFPEVIADQIKPVEVRKLPVLGKVACGEPLFMDEDREYIDIKDAPRNVDFILIAKGDSMINAGIKDGDYVFIEKRSSVNNGEIAVVVIDDEATLKRVHFDKEKQVLQLLPENPSYAPMIYMGEELERIQVLGKAIAVMSLLK